MMKKSLVEDNNAKPVNIVQSSIVEAIEPVLNTQKNKENENHNHNSNEGEISIQVPEQLPHQRQGTQNNGVYLKTVCVASKLPSYLEKLPYAEGQWSATNPTGEKKYSKQFLLQLGTETVCQKKPNILRNWGHITKLSNSSQYSSLQGMVLNLPRSQSASATGFVPSYFKNGNSQHGMPLMKLGTNCNSSQGETAINSDKPNTIHISLSLGKEVKLNQTDNAWVPTAAKKATMFEAPKNKNEEESKTEEVNKGVRSILNKMTPNNMILLTERFKALPIDTIERLEKTIDLVFEKAIEEQSFAPLYASLCSAMQSVQVNCGESNKPTSFRTLIITKCQSLFELHKAQEMNSAKKLAEINYCKDPEKKKELQMEYEKNERRLRKRSVGNCRFIGELFKQKVLTPNIMLYCIVNLVTNHVEESLECLCNLLETVGKELEQFYNLNETFNKLKALTSKEMKSKIPSRIRFMIQDVIDLRRNKWVPRRNDSKPKLINEIENDAKNEAIKQSKALSSYNRSDKNDHYHSERDEDKGFRGGRYSNKWNVVQSKMYKQQNYVIDQSNLQGLQRFKAFSSVKTLGSSLKRSYPIQDKNSNVFTGFNTFAVPRDNKKSLSTSQMMSSKNTQRKPATFEYEERQTMMSKPLESVVELDPEMANKINLQCKNIIQEYERLHNLDDIIYSLVEDQKSEIRTKHERFVSSVALITLDSKPNSRTEAGKMLAELLSKKVISMAAITQGIDAILKDWNDYLMDYPQFFSYIAAIIAPLLISKTASFEFNNLKDACISIRPDNLSVIFIEVLKIILSSKETQNIKEVGGILWIYNKWWSSKYVPLDAFMPTRNINKFFKNDRVGVFLLSVSMYDEMKLNNGKKLYDLMQNWITSNINEEIIKCPQFIRALTIAIIIVCMKTNHSFEEFFDHDQVKLLTCYIWSDPLSDIKIQAREVQCLYGIQIMSAALEHSGGMILRLFLKLYQDSVIRKESFETWKKEHKFSDEFHEDQETKTMAVVILNSFFLSIMENDSDEEEIADI